MIIFFGSNFLKAVGYQSFERRAFYHELIDYEPWASQN
jgi:hypothetical protein